MPPDIKDPVTCECLFCGSIVDIEGPAETANRARCPECLKVGFLSIETEF